MTHITKGVSPFVLRDLFVLSDEGPGRKFARLVALTLPPAGVPHRNGLETACLPIQRLRERGCTFGRPRRVDIWMGTLSKTLAGCGGYIAGSTELVEYLRLTVGAFVFSVGIPPAIAAAAHKALEILHREPERVHRLQSNGAHFSALARRRGLDTGTGAGTAICPIMVGDSLPAVALSKRLLERGINVLPVTHPAVPAKSARLRFFLSAMHTRAEIEGAVETTAEELEKVRERAAEFDLSRYEG
jgi:Aminotransferase class I and II